MKPAILAALLAAACLVSQGAAAQTCDEDALLANDADADGLPDIVERYLGTDARTPDTDLDGLADPEEAFGTSSPLEPDSDGDGYCDGDLAIGEVCRPIEERPRDPEEPECGVFGDGTEPPDIRGANVLGCASATGDGALLWLALALGLSRRRGRAASSSRARVRSR